VDRYHADVAPVPDPTFHFEADPDTNPSPSFTHVGKCWKILIFFLHTSIVTFIRCHRVIILNIMVLYQISLKTV
jgi:hypothetical protein